MKRLTIALALGASLAAFGCSEREPPERTEVSAADVRKEATEAADASARYVEQEKDQFVRAAQEELGQLQQQLASLKSQAQTASGEAKAALAAQVAEIEGRWQAAEAKLAELKAAGAGKWQEAKANFNEQMRELKRSFERDKDQHKQG